MWDVATTHLACDVVGEGSYLAGGRGDIKRHKPIHELGDGGREQRGPVRSIKELGDRLDGRHDDLEELVRGVHVDGRDEGLCRGNRVDRRLRTKARATNNYARYAVRFVKAKLA